MSKFVQLVKWIGALGVAILFFVGVPFGLWQAVGSPLPDAGTSWSGIVDMLFTSQGVADSTVIKIAAVVAWLAWLHLAYVAVRESVSVIRTTVPPAIRGGSFTQRLVRPVVSTLFYLGGASSSIISMAPAAGASPAMEQVVVPLSEGLGDVESATISSFGTHDASAATIEVFADSSGGFVDAQTSERQSALIPGAVLYEVQSGDNLWDIAEAHLGDGQRWREIYENSNSYDQLEGGVLNDEDMIHPQWILQLPSDAEDVPEPDASLVERLFGVITEAAEGIADEVDEVADEVAGVGEAGAESDGVDTDADAGTEDDGGADEAGAGGIDLDLPLVAPVVITPVDEADVDSEPGLSDPALEYSEEEAMAESDAEVVAPGAGDVVEAPVVTAAPVEVEAPEVNADEGNMVVAAMAAAGLLAATGLGAHFLRKHLVKKRDRDVGEAVTQNAVATEARRGLTGGGNDEVAAWLYAAFDSVAARGSEVVAGPQPALFAMHSHEALDAVFVPSPNMNVPDPWTDQSSTGKVWELSTEVEVADLGPRDPYAWGAPSVVSAGDGVWLNLEWFGLAAVQGDDEEVGNWLRSLCADLMFGPAAPIIDLKVSEKLADRLGPLRFDKASQPPATFNTSLRTSLESVRDDASFDAYDHRINGSPDADRFGPAILLVDDSEVGEIEDLIELAGRDGMPVVVLVVGDYDTPHVFTVRKGELQFKLGEQNQAFKAASISVKSVEAFAEADDDASYLQPAMTADAAVELAAVPEVDSSPTMADQALGEIEPSTTEADPEPEPDTRTEEVDAGEVDRAWYVEKAELAGGRAVLIDASDSEESDDTDEGETEEEPASEVSEEPQELDEAEESEAIDLTDESAAADGAESSTATAAPIMLNILGELEVTGVDKVPRGKQVPLVAYLAINGPTEGKKLRESIYPEKPTEKSGRSLASVVHRSTEVFGTGAIRGDASGVYSLDTDMVGCDWVMARSLLMTAKRTEDDGDAVEALAAGLKYVRGAPLGSTAIRDRMWDWFYDHDYGVLNEIEMLVSDSALRLSTILRDVGELETALEICALGRKVSKHWTILAQEHVLVLLLLGRREEAERVVTVWEAHDEALTDDEAGDDVRRVLVEFEPVAPAEKAVS